MERDTNRTFRDIHSSENALQASMDEIETYLLEPQADSAHFSIRFITLHENGYDEEKDLVHLRLTPVETIMADTEHCTVSYTRMQPKNAAQFSIPNYVVWTSNVDSRSLNCPSLVLQRALEAARQISRNPRIWIDQECINQDDVDDVESHLQIMHKIYEQSSLWRC